MKVIGHPGMRLYARLPCIVMADDVHEFADIADKLSMFLLREDRSSGSKSGFRTFKVKYTELGFSDAQGSYLAILYLNKSRREYRQLLKKWSAS